MLHRAPSPACAAPGGSGSPAPLAKESGEGHEGAAEWNRNVLSGHSEYIAVCETLFLLERQLEQACKDVGALYALKEDSLAHPEDFIARLASSSPAARSGAASPADGGLSFPCMQVICPMPQISLAPYRRRFSRRNNSKYEQNLEYFVNAIASLQEGGVRSVGRDALQTRVPPAPPLLSVGASSAFSSASLGASRPSSPLVGEAATPTASLVRERFCQIANRPIRAASAPAVSVGEGAVGTRRSSASSSRNSAGSPRRPRGGSAVGEGEEAAIAAPRPVKRAASTVFDGDNFALPFLPSPHATNSARAITLFSSAYPPSPIGEERGRGGAADDAIGDFEGQACNGEARPFPAARRARDAPSSGGRVHGGAEARLSSHHNLPWSEVERRRLDELLLIYPEEAIQARRFAKIAAALGTRSAGQVSNRVNKLQVQERRRQQGSEEAAPTDIDALLGREAKRTAEYREYVRLCSQVEALEARQRRLGGASGPAAGAQAGSGGRRADGKGRSRSRAGEARTDVKQRRVAEAKVLPVEASAVHHNYACDGCGCEPIVGDRWHCLRCREPHAIDLCSACHAEGTFERGSHRRQHQFLKHSGL